MRQTSSQGYRLSRLFQAVRHPHRQETQKLDSYPLDQAFQKKYHGNLTEHDKDYNHWLLDGIGAGAKTPMLKFCYAIALNLPQNEKQYFKEQAIEAIDSHLQNITDEVNQVGVPTKTLLSIQDNLQKIQEHEPEWEAIFKEHLLDHYPQAYSFIFAEAPVSLHIIMSDEYGSMPQPS